MADTSASSVPASVVECPAPLTMMSSQLDQVFESNQADVSGLAISNRPCTKTPGIEAILSMFLKTSPSSSHQMSRKYCVMNPARAR